MTDTLPLKLPNLPAELSETLTVLRGDLLEAGGSNVSSIILYGGLARGRYRAGVSNVNLLLLLADPSIRALAKLAPTLHSGWRSVRLEPYILGAAELARTAEAFPTRFWDIQHNHVLLAGDDPFPSLAISPRAIRLRIEQELRNLAIRLRRRFVLLQDDRAAQQRALSGVVVPLAVSLAALLELSGKSTKAVFADAANAFSLDSEALAYLKTLRQGGSAGAQPEAMFDRVLATILRTADLAAVEEAR